MLRNAILIAGPTASGKSALAVEVAQRTGGVVVNADSMQVYSVLSVLTARPGERDLSAVPHRLYGHVHPSTAYSTGKWLDDVRRLEDEGLFAACRPIFVGGTGLYFQALTGGLSPMPDIPSAVRALWRERLLREGAPALHAVLRERDPATAAQLQPADGQRITRALEVLEASGRSIGAWQATASRPLVDVSTARLVVLQPERALVNERIEIRFQRMVEAGALDEVRALLGLGLDPRLPAMKAIGVKQLGGALAGRLTMAEAVKDAKTATRRYAKRQATWFGNRFGAAWMPVPIRGGEAFKATLGKVMTALEDEDPFALR